MRRDLHLLLRTSGEPSMTTDASGGRQYPTQHRAEALTLSLVVVTYNRERELLDSLRLLQPHQELFREIVIVDNGGAGDLRERAEALFGEGRCRVIQPPGNLGAVGRTLGILETTSDLVVTLDDDVQLMDPRELLHLRSLFAGASPAGCVNLKILYADNRSLDLSDWCHPRNPEVYQDRLFDTAYISEGACVLNGPLVRQLGAYPLDLYIGQEGMELAARILDAGYSILYSPNVRVTHSVAQTGRTPGRQFYYNARNIYWIALRCYPLGLGLRTVAREWSMLLVLSLLRGRLGYFLRGCRDGLRRTSSIRRERRPIGRGAAHHIHRLNRLKPSVLERFGRVFGSRTLT